MFNGCVPMDLGPPANGHPALPWRVTSVVSHPAEIVIDPVSVNDSALDIVQEWGEQSFPASDPPSNW